MKYVYTYGVFDLFHAGHVQLLREAAQLGDYLIVGLFPDKTAEEFKRKPIISYDQRLQVLRSLKVVNEVISQKDVSPVSNIYKIYDDHSMRSDSLVVVKGPGAGWENQYQEIGKRVNVLTLLLPYHEGISTSEIIKKCQSLK